MKQILTLLLLLEVFIRSPRMNMRKQEEKEERKEKREGEKEEVV